MFKNPFARAARVGKLEEPASRISSLDGLRGLAIILVVINHLPLDPINAIVDRISPSIAPLYAGNGKTGVSLLLMLSGYLLMTFYPRVPKALSFWQKRYTRIFPALVTMCISLGLIAILGHFLPVFMRVLVAVVVAAIVGKLWRMLQGSPNRKSLGKAAFLAFFGIQIATALYYVFVLTRTPAQVFYVVWPVWIQHIVTIFVNATMTLPLGNYIGQLDGVYWSLTLEVMFYVLYPILVLPLLGVIQSQKSATTKTLMIALILPCILGFTRFVPHVLGLYILNIQYFVYFLAGMAASQFDRSSLKLWKSWQHLGTKLGAWSVVIAGLALLTPVAIYPYLPQDIHPLVNIVLAIPMTLMFGWTVAPTAWSKLMQNTKLVYLGMISYSLYLTHSFIISVWDTYIKPNTVFTTVIVGVFAALTSLVIARFLYECVEKPYFNKPPRTLINKATDALKPSKPSVLQSPRFAIISFLVFTVAILVGMWIAYRPPISLMSTVSNFSSTEVGAETNITTKPTLIHVDATQPNLAMIFMHVQGHGTGDLVAPQLDNDPSMLVASVYDDQGRQLSINRYKINDIGDGRSQPIGLPVQPDSKGRVYTVSLSIEHAQPDQGISLVNDTTLFRPVYVINKSTLLHAPALLVKTALNSALFPYEQPEAIKSLLLIGPFFLGMLLLCIKSQMVYLKHE